MSSISSSNCESEQPTESVCSPFGVAGHMSIVLSIMSLSSSYCIGEHPTESTSKSPSPSMSVSIVLAHKSWLSKIPSKSVSVCDGEHPLLLAISFEGVFGQESILSFNPSMSVSL